MSPLCFNAEFTNRGTLQNVGLLAMNWVTGKVMELWDYQWLCHLVNIPTSPIHKPDVNKTLECGL